MDPDELTRTAIIGLTLLICGGTASLVTFVGGFIAIIVFVTRRKSE